MDLMQLCRRKAFLFDFDGVITDSEPYVFEVLKSLVHDNYGIVLPDSDISMTIGCSDDDVIRYIADAYGIGLTPEKAEELKASYPDYYTEYAGIKPFPDLEELLELLLERGIAATVVSSTDRYRLETALARMGLSRFFGLIIGGDDVMGRKPDPEPYRRALDILGISASQAVAVEDSPPGLASASGAGVAAIAFRGSAVKQDIAMASASVASYSEIIEAMRRA